MSSSDRKESALALMSIELRDKECVMHSIFEDNSAFVLFCSLSTFMDASNKTGALQSLRMQQTTWSVELLFAQY